jgi:hypothetical protein
VDVLDVAVVVEVEVLAVSVEVGAEKAEGEARWSEDEESGKGKGDNLKKDFFLNSILFSRTTRISELHRRLPRPRDAGAHLAIDLVQGYRKKSLNVRQTGKKRQKKVVFPPRFKYEALHKFTRPLHCEHQTHQTRQ